MKIPGTDIRTSMTLNAGLQSAAEAAAKTITHEQLMEARRPKFLASVNEEITRAAGHAQTKLQYVKGQYPYDLAVFVADEFKSLGYKYEVSEESLLIEWAQQEEGVN